MAQFKLQNIFDGGWLFLSFEFATNTFYDKMTIN